MATALKGMMKRVVEVVVPPPPVITAPPRGPRNDSPVLGERPGIDRSIYEPSEGASTGRGDEAIATVHGKTHRLFFLCSHPFAGADRVGDLLNLCTQIHVTGDYHFETLREAFSDLKAHKWHAPFHEPMRTETERAFRDCVRRILGISSEMKPWAEWLGDRTCRSLSVLLPGAHHILVLRDPREVMVEWALEQFRSAGHHYSRDGLNLHLDVHRASFLKDAEYFTSNPGALLGGEGLLERLAGAWRHHTRSDLAALKAVADGETDARVLVLRFEKIATDPGSAVDEMLDFLGLDAPESAPDVAPIGEGFKPIDWRMYFGDDVKRRFKEAAGDTLIELGYENKHNW